MSLFDAFKDVPPSAVDIISVLIGTIFRIIKAGVDNEGEHEAALMDAQDAIKRYLDRKKFPGETNIG